MSSTGQDVWFKPIKESWNIYMLEDGTELRIRLIVIKFVRTSQYDALGNPIYGMASQNVLSVKSSDGRLRGNPVTGSYTPEQIAASERVEVKITQTIVEDWNEYHLDDGTVVRLKLVVSKASRSGLYDQLGEPVYLVETQNLLRFDVPKGLQKK